MSQFEDSQDAFYYCAAKYSNPPDGRYDLRV